MPMNHINHVVLLMLENQSFDSMLGWLYENGAEPDVNIPSLSQGEVAFDGLYGVDPEKYRNIAPNGQWAQPTRGVEGFSVPTPDPGEEFEHVNMQLFGTETPAPGAVPTMTGFLADYVDVMQSLGYSADQITVRAPSIMESYSPAQLPVLNQLAQHYAVCDAWFSSVPSQTNPNRAFAMSGTSYGLVNNGELEANPQAKLIEQIAGIRIGDDRFPQPTIFNSLQALGRDWNVFWQTSYLPQKISALLALADSKVSLLYPPLAALLFALKPFTQYLKDLTSGQLSSCYTWRLFEAIQALPNASSHFASLDTFHTMARAGKLPAFSYIEPLWTISQSGTETGVGKRLVTAMGNDYHPPSNKLVGEAFVKSVYESLIANESSWASTLLIITFDEPVGSFDHVAPPATVPPWGPNGSPPFKSDTGFAFNRLGARVPTILVSPLIQKSTVFRSATDVAYDHSSIVTTVLDWAGATPAQLAAFGARTAVAPTFDDVVMLSTPRTDARDLPFLQQGGQDLNTPVNYGDTFLLRHQSGQYLAAFTQASKSAVIPNALPAGIAVDLEIAAYFPTLARSGTAVQLTMFSRQADSGAVADGDSLWLVSTETGLVADNVLGKWADSYDCYWFDLYLDGQYAANQLWTVHNENGPGPVLYGQPFRLVNSSYNQGLSQDSRPTLGKWITTSTSGDWWTIMPCTPQQ